MEETIIQDLGEFSGNHLFVKRDDMIPFSFGGNKARKAQLFLEDYKKGDYDCVVTYGASSSNHCRVISNICAMLQTPCFIIEPEEVSEQTFNRQMMSLFGAEVTVVPVSEVHDTIEDLLMKLRATGNRPYFIPGGGHGNIGTEAYAQCYQEIRDYEQRNRCFFDYIFFASGTGTTHAGLVSGQLLAGDVRKIVGISIARPNPRGRDVVINSIRNYLGDRVSDRDIEDNTIFIDDYVGDGYARQEQGVSSVIESVMRAYGIPLDPVYTGKAFFGMQKYMKEENVQDKKILFIHTGGIPLFFDHLENKREQE